MRPAIDPAAEIAARALGDIQSAERQMRQQAEAALREYVQLLTAIARHFAGDELEEARRTEPTAIQGWQPAQWNAFFCRHILLPGRPILPPGAMWGGTESTQVQKILELLEQQVRDLQRQAAGLQEANAQMQERLAQSEAALGQASVENQALRRQVSGGGEEFRITPTLKKPPVPAGSPVGHKAILEALAGWKAPRTPSRFAHIARLPAARWERLSMALYIIAAGGISVRPEVDTLLSQANGADRRTTALREVVDDLGELGLVERRKLNLSEPFSTTLVALRLSEQGQKLCSALEWETVPGDWERLAQGSEVQHLSTLSFVYHARLRGYQALISPEPVDGLQADALVEKGSERSYVFIGAEEKTLLERWQAANKRSLSTGLCTLNDASRSSLAEQCRALQPQVHGAAADLDTLLHQKEASPDKPLWIEIW